MDTKALKQKILDLAIRGKLVPQNPNDEPAAVLLEKIRAEKQQMVKEGKLKAKDIKNDTIIFRGEDNLHYEQFQDGTVKCIEDEIPFEVPAGWEWCRLGSIFITLTGNTPSTKQPELYGTDYPFYKPTDLDAGYYVTDSSDHVSVLGYESGRTLESTSVLVTCIGATIGKTGYIRSAGICNQQINAILPTKHIVPEYTFLCMNSEFEQNQILQNSSATTLPILNKSKFDKLLFVVPPFEQQRKIVAIINQTINCIDSIESDKKMLKRYIATAKIKILDLAIQGKLVPQNPDDEPASVLLERIRAEKEELIKAGKIKQDKKESIIYRGEDNSYYEKFQNGTTKCIEDEIPFDDLPNTWTYERLKNIVVVNPKNEILDDIDVSFVPMTLIADQYSGIYEYEKRRWETCKKGFTHFAEGDIAFAKISPCFENRKSVYFDNLVNGYGAGTTELYVLRFYNRDIEPYYILNLIKSEYFIARGKRTFSGVVGQQRVNKDTIFNTLIPIPPISEQIKIVKQEACIMNHLEQIEAALI